MNFKWNNEIDMFRTWNPEAGLEIVESATPKEIVNNPEQTKFEDILRACCTVLSELMEIEENRAKFE